MSSSASQLNKDPWSSEAYSISASFVPKLTQILLRYLDPQPTDKILDIGCGDGKFTDLFLPYVKRVLGVDASPAMIDSAKRDYGHREGAEFRVLDCCYLERDEDVTSGGWDKVVSNAALHWILRNPQTRLNTLKGIHAALEPGGTFVFEMGGHGNVPEIGAAMQYALLTRGFTMSRIREIYPWFFPSDVWMRSTLEGIGFKVHKMEIEYRPTRLTNSVNGGLAGWVRLMGAAFLDALEESEREGVVEEVCEVLERVVTREEDGSQWLGYVRLRGVAEKI